MEKDTQALFQLWFIAHHISRRIMPKVYGLRCHELASSGSQHYCSSHQSTQESCPTSETPRHPPKMHTALAGFVEAGETFEQAIRREVFEETGVCIDTDSVSYIGSQPWPFPRSCMIDFHATVDENQETNMDEEELVEFAWFDFDDVVKASIGPGAVMLHEVAKKAMENDPTLPLLIPPHGVLARKLIDSWLLQS